MSVDSTQIAFRVFDFSFFDIMATFSMVETNFTLLSLVAIIPFPGVEKYLQNSCFAQIYHLGKEKNKVAEINEKRIALSVV